MPVVSIRFSDMPLHQRLKGTARQRNIGISTLAERLIDEGLRMDAHPFIVFRDGATGRRAVLMGGPEIVDVVGAVVGGDVPVEDRRSRAANLLGINEALVDAAMAYYASFTDEIDDIRETRAALADEAESAWRKQQELLSS